jgi:outer membrane protein assembly factor BamB
MKPAGVLVPRAALAALAALAGLMAALPACGDNLPGNQCVTGWPATARPFVPAAPIAGVTPAILWRTRFGSAMGDWLVLTDDRLAFPTSTSLYILDHDGNLLRRRTSPAFEVITSAVADREGNFYFAGHSVYSVDRDGEFRWLAPLPGDPGLYPYPRAVGRMVMSPDGALFFGATDGYLYAVEGQGGFLRWRTPITGEDERPPVVLGGAGDAVLAIARDGEPRAQLWHTRTGKPVAHLVGPDGERHGAMLGRELGIVAQRMEDRGGAYPWMHVSVLDTCGNERWSLPAKRPQWPALIGPEDRLFMVERDDVEGSPTFVSVYDQGGKRVAGPVEMPPPWGIGADGTVYALTCDSSGYEGPSRLHAYDAALGELWSLPLGDSCPMAGPVIDDRGRLYFAWYIDNTAEVVAVQTASPGLAVTSWPVRRHDARGTGWLD